MMPPSIIHDNSDSVISIENLSKRYSIGRNSAKGDGLRHAIEDAIRSPFAWFSSRLQKKTKEVDFWALKDVSIQIKRGEVVGIIGRNGAGKSTLLKLLSRITVPTEGRIRIEGRIASLLEVGTGFHPELTGRENIFLNGAILGMTRAEIIRKFDEIVEFSEIEEFLDTPVKRYSSGMYVRLAFSVAAHLDPEILIVDEVLAVGDTSFQKKCLGKIRSFAESGRTVLYVSHNLDSIRNLCKRLIWIKDGHLHQDGPLDEVFESYLNSIAVESTHACANHEYGLVINEVELRNDEGERSNVFLPGDNLIVDISYDALKRIERPYIAVGVLGINGSCFASNMLLDGQTPDYLEGKGRIRCTFKSIPLLPQNYTVKMSIRASTVTDMIVPYREVAYFKVDGDLGEYGYQGEYVTWASQATPVVVPYEWELPDGRITEVSLSKPVLYGESVRATSDRS
jgi:lipopolysaccharide transport system ATP-binding protein